MLRRVGVLGVNETRSFTTTILGEVSASLVRLVIGCMQPDGTWKGFDVLAGEMPSAIPGVGTLAFPIMTIRIVNAGTATGTLYMRVTDDTGAEIYYKECLGLAPGDECDNSEVVFDMPERTYALTVEVGHL